jgi:hypothetical protein
MRRPPEVGLVVCLLLGATGCTGFQQRLSEPPAGASRTVGDETPPPRFSWLRPRAAAPVVTPGSASETSQVAPRTVATGRSGDVWPETQSEWMARNLPRISRLWKQDTTVGRRDGVDSVPPSLVSRGLVRSGDGTASTARADRDVRPVDSSSDDDPRESAASPPARAQLRSQPTRSANPPSVTDRPHSLPESTGAVELDVSGSNAGPGAAGSTDERGHGPADAKAAEQPADSKPWADGPVPAPTASTDRASGVPAALANVVPASDEEKPAPKDAAAVAPPTEADATASSPVNSAAPAIESAQRAAGGEDTRMAQAPAQPAVRQVPPAPPITDGAKAADSPPTPPAATSAETNAPPATETPAPAAAPAQPAAAAASAQPTVPPAPTGQAAGAASPATPRAVAARPAVTASPQSIYASPPPVASAPHKCKLFGWLHHDQTAEPLVAPQLPPATFPTSYRTFSPAPYPGSPQPAGKGSKAPSVAAQSPAVAAQTPLATAQSPAVAAQAPLATAQSPAVAAQAPLATAQSPAVAAAQAPLATAQSPAVAAQAPLAAAQSPAVAAQAPLATAQSPAVAAQAPLAAAQSPCANAVKAPKKPCFLKVWIHKLKSSGHGADCGECEHASRSTCCGGCACCGKNTMVAPSPQSNPATTPRNTATAPGKTAAAQENAATGIETTELAPAPTASR